MPAAQVRGFLPASHFDVPRLSYLDRSTQLLLVAAREAVRDAGLDFDDGLRGRTAVVTGSCLGGVLTLDSTYRAFYDRGRKKAHPMTIPRIMTNAGASQISIELGTTGPAFTLSTACSSSSHALGMAFSMVRDGTCDLAIAGGAEAPFCLGNLRAWEATMAMAPDTCRPFDADRKGMVLGEGAAVLILETTASAMDRGARVYAELSGFGMSADGRHMVQPDVEGAARAMTTALRDAGIGADQVDYVNAHGTGTPLNDAAESRALHQVFGGRAGELPVSSTKSIHGHALGAAGAIEAAATVLAIHEATVPPTANFRRPAPDCPLHVVAGEARPLPIQHALSNSFAFGGLNAVLVFSRDEGART